MNRVAIYARMSLEKQSSESTGDQIARCRDFADQRGWQVVEELIFTDKTVSGGTRYNRPDLLELVDRVLEWDVLLCYDFTRLARNSEDLGWIERLASPLITSKSRNTVRISLFAFCRSRLWAPKA